MKKLTVLLTVLLTLGLLIRCGSKDSESEKSKTDTSREQKVVTDKDIEEQSKKSKEEKGKSAREVGLKALKAIKDLNYETVKKTVDPAMAMNMDKSFIQDKKEEYLQDWDGQIKGVKYRKDKRTGLPQAVIYYADKDEQHIMVHILDRTGSLGEQWYAFGGMYGFEEISKQEFDNYASELKNL
ncbi:MAG: hypothetical protein R6V04_02610 [bacterium]